MTSQKGQTKPVSFKDGIDTYKDNDDLKPSQLLAGIDVRFAKIGRYKTRQGAARYSVPIGEAVNVSVTSTTGASTTNADGLNYAAQKLTAASTARLTRIDVNLKKTASAAGTILVELRADSAGSPGDLIATSSIAASAVSTTAAYLPCYFITAPDITNGTSYWVVVRGQSTSVTGYQVTTTTSATTAKTSANAGVSYSTTSFALNVKLYTATSGGVKGVHRAYRPNGQKVTFMWHGSTMYSVDDGTGATTSVKTGLDASATKYRAQMVQDAVYYVNGLEKPYKYDFSTTTQLTSSPYTPSLILEHKGLLMFVDADDKTRLYYTNFAAFDTFTSTDFIYVPAPKSYDSLTALAKLNGVLYLFANRNKFQLYGSDNATFSLDEAASQRGTFSQESVVFDANFIYHADEEGIWQFNGTAEKNLALPFLEDYKANPNKNKIVLDIYNGRLFAFYPSEGSAENDQCYVMNLGLDVFESIDTNAYVGMTFGRYAQDDIFIQASNRVGAIYYGESSTSDYTQLGAPLEYELRTAYSHYETPGQYKRAPKWRPSFASADADYSVQCGYAFDFGDDVTYQDVSLLGTGVQFDDGVLFDNGAVFAGQSIVEPTNLLIPGKFKRLQRRYKHVAAREPVEMLREIISIETMRMI